MLFNQEDEDEIHGSQLGQAYLAVFHLFLVSFLKASLVEIETNKEL